MDDDTVPVFIASVHKYLKSLRKRLSADQTRRRKIWVREWIDRKGLGAAHQLFNELRHEDPASFRYVVEVRKY